MPQLSGNIIGRGSWAYGEATILIERKGGYAGVFLLKKRESERKIREQEKAGNRRGTEAWQDDRSPSTLPGAGLLLGTVALGDET